MAEIVEAMDRNQLVVHYQPVVECTDRRVIGAEALVRWDNPVLGRLEPDEFLPLFDQGDIKLAISQWVIERSISFVNQVNRAGLSIAVSINIFPEQSYDREFFYMLRRYLERVSQKQRPQLQIEIPEQVVVSNFEQIERFVNDCLEMGVECVLDDFDAGDISMQQLARLPVRYVKVNRRLTQKILFDEKEYELIKGILSVADGFGKEIIFEGVEDMQQFLKLRDLGATLMQGYLFSEAIPEAMFETWAKSFSDSSEWAERFTPI